MKKTVVIIEVDVTGRTKMNKDQYMSDYISYVKSSSENQSIHPIVIESDKFNVTVVYNEEALLNLKSVIEDSDLLTDRLKSNFSIDG